MTNTRIYLLGAMQIERNGSVLSGIRSQKAMALLGYLALESRPVARTTLAALFWGNDPEKNARRELRRVIHNLTTLIPGCLIADRHTVYYDSKSNLWLDVEKFTTDIKTQNPDSLQQAADLYRGELMEGLNVYACARFETWLLGRRELYRQQAFQVFQQLIAFHSEQSDFVTAVAHAQRCLSIDPWREEIHRKLMLLLARNGQYSAALKQFEICRTILKAELGVEPSPDTIKLYDRIRGATAVANHNFPPDVNAPAIIHLRQLLEGLP